MSRSTVRTAVHSAIEASVPEHVRTGYNRTTVEAAETAIVEAVEGLFDEAVADLTVKAQEKGYGRQAEGIISASALAHDPEPEPEAAPVEENEDGVLARLQATVNSLVEFARGKGYRG